MINWNHVQSLYLLFHKMFHVKEVTDDYTILHSDCMIVCNATKDITITLPAGTNLDKNVGYSIFSIKNISSKLVTVRGNDITVDEIDGETEQDVNEGDCMKVQYVDANDWRII